MVGLAEVPSDNSPGQITEEGFDVEVAIQEAIDEEDLAFRSSFQFLDLEVEVAYSAC